MSEGLEFLLIFLLELPLSILELSSLAQQDKHADKTLASFCKKGTIKGNINGIIILKPGYSSVVCVGNGTKKLIFSLF